MNPSHSLGKPVLALVLSASIVTPPDSAGVVRVRARSNSLFYWCGRIFVYPVLPGRSGTYPTRPLGYFFGG